MEYRDLHSWRLSYAEARQKQLEIADLVVRKGKVKSPRFIAGIDARYEGSRGVATGAIVIVTYPDLKPVEVKVSRSVPLFPYIPGLLSFRECPVILEAWRKLRISPGLVIVDGQGIAHPRRVGLGAHLGLFLDLPTIGCAKSRLCGEHAALRDEAGRWTRLKDKGDVIGAVVRTRTGSKPVYVSIGHKVDLPSAIRWSLACCAGRRLPEPARLAHLAANGKIGEIEP